MKIKLDNGHEAEVTHAVRLDGSVLVTAISGEHAHQHVLTLGAIDQPLPDDYTSQQLVTDLDAARKHAAAMAASKARKHILLSGL